MKQNIGNLALVVSTALSLVACSSAPKRSETPVQKTDAIRISQSSSDVAQDSYIFDEMNDAKLSRMVSRMTGDLEFAKKKPESCPGMSLAVSCGNGTCESDKGEDKNTCPADCVPAPIVSYNNQTRCVDIKRVFKPTTTEEVQKIVQDAVAQGLHVKVVGNSHSANQILCTDGVAIVTENMNKALKIEMFEGEETVLLEPGIKLWDLTEWLHERNRSIGYSVMGFRGVTIAGAIGTGAHGSSARHNSVISNIVKSLTVVGADGQVHEFSKGTTPETTWKALTANFGLLGVITQMRLKVYPQVNLDTHVTYHKDAELFKEGGPFALVEECDWGILNWFPGSKHFVKTCGVATDKTEDRGATNMLLNPSIPKGFVKLTKQMIQLSACNNKWACGLDKIRYWLLTMAPPIMKENLLGKLKPSKHVIGPSHRMQSSVLTPYQHGFFQMDWEIAVPKSRAAEAMLWVRDHIKKNNICVPLVGIFLRFAKAEDESLLAHTTAYKDFVKDEPVVFIEIPIYLPVGFTDEMKAKYDKVYEDFAKALIQNYGARAHWGKNRDWVFAMERDLDVYGENMKKFQSVVDQLDPTGVFSNRFAENMGITYKK